MQKARGPTPGLLLCYFTLSREKISAGYEVKTLAMLFAAADFEEARAAGFGLGEDAFFSPPATSSKPLPARNAGALRAGIVIFAPVLGLRPVCFLRERTTRFTKGIKRTSSPVGNVSVTASKINATTSLVRRCESSAPCAMMSMRSCSVITRARRRRLGFTTS